ncbi:hypothetical protein BFP72_12255 [Reichenbachiella sp. 5M10]|uniref:methyl-accepting chemotaxis protein n=1 Tax=Reichenbachiella sp. 5M10 TaxID=1889772 RepID=UPI000C149296|nr:methyl-accepting chemotaxis protein [Reichenbachiella sp. 5M10]PIB36112.1 hypothetical protein BFP72_12255 [Reichenbachiella sp. 5M10]
MNSEIANGFETISKKTEVTMQYAVIGLFLFGVGISFHYDTWAFGLGVGGLNVLLFLMARFFFSGQLVVRLVTGAVMAIFMLQFVAQLHGLFEMHFWFFILPIVLIMFQDWRVYIPFGLIVTIHHVFIFYMYMQGNDQYNVYLFNTNEVTLSTFLYHMGLAVLGVLISVWTSYRLKSESDRRIESNHHLNAQLEEMKEVTHRVREIASEVISAESSMEAKEGDQSASAALATMGADFSKAINGLIQDTNEVVTLAGAQGDLSTRMELIGKRGNWKLMAESINNLLLSISTPVLKVTEMAQAMANGDLTKRYDVEASGDVKVLADNLNAALEKIASLLVQISGDINTLKNQSTDMLSSGKEMEGATNEIVSAITQMSTGAHRQLSSIENVSQVLEDTLATARNLEEKTLAVMKSTKSGTESSERGKEIVKAVVGDMERISSYSSETRESIQVLNERSAEISRVLGVITDISSQTNLLALNAAIEAAQAGESGRGFAVVAEEIRKLAEGSRESAQQIEKLVSDVKRDTENASKIIQEMNASVNSGVSSSQKTAEVFELISESSAESMQLSEEILKDSQTQVKSMSSVVTDVESVVVIAEQTAAGTEEVNTSANELASGMTNYIQTSTRLNDMAVELKEGISRFKLN